VLSWKAKDGQSQGAASAKEENVTSVFARTGQRTSLLNLHFSAIFNEKNSQERYLYLLITHGVTTPDMHLRCKYRRQ
jgi:hypothetical protein